MKEKKSMRLQLRLYPIVLHRLRALSLSQHVSMSEFIECLINREWYEQVNFSDVNLYELDDLSDVAPEIYM